MSVFLSLKPCNDWSRIALLSCVPCPPHVLVSCLGSSPPLAVLVSCVGVLVCWCLGQHVMWLNLLLSLCCVVMCCLVLSYLVLCSLVYPSRVALVLYWLVLSCLSLYCLVFYCLALHGYVISCLGMSELVLSLHRSFCLFYLAPCPWCWPWTSPLTLRNPAPQPYLNPTLPHTQTLTLTLTHAAAGLP